MAALMLVSITAVFALVFAIAVARRRRARGACAHPARRTRGRTRDRNRSSGLVVACALAATIAHDADAATSTARVIHVDDGDTLIVAAGQQQTVVRLVEIDAPEHDQPYGPQSKQSLIDLCLEQQATIDATGVDEYGRTLAHVRCRGLDANQEQVRRGLAWVYDRYVVDRSLYIVQNLARSGSRGLWADGNPTPPWQWRHTPHGASSDAPPSLAPAAQSDQTQCRIKGNINNHGERIYHVPGQKYYDQTIIDTASGERWFCTEAEAVAAGWRRSKV